MTRPEPPRDSEPTAGELLFVVSWKMGGCDGVAGGAPESKTKAAREKAASVTNHVRPKWDDQVSATQDGSCSASGRFAVDEVQEQVEDDEDGGDEPVVDGKTISSSLLIQDESGSINSSSKSRLPHSINRIEGAESSFVEQRSFDEMEIRLVRIHEPHTCPDGTHC